MKTVEAILDEKGFRYSEVDFWENPVIGKEITRLNWGNPKYKGHFKTVKGYKHFDEFVMNNLKIMAEKNQTLNECVNLSK